MRFVAIGAANVDRVYLARNTVRAETSNPARVQRGFGGVARNVAENLARLGADVRLYSCVGDDDEGRALLADLEKSGCDTSCVRIRHGCITAEYAAILEPDGELFASACDAGVLDDLSVGELDEWLSAAADASWVFLDCNPPPAVIAACVARRSASSWRLAIDGTSAAKVASLPVDLSNVDLLFLNEDETGARGDCNAQALVLMRGARGVRLVRNGVASELPAVESRPRNVTGAGDALIAGTLFALQNGEPLESAVHNGLQLAARAVASPASVAR
jgi:pseudouridine kinase